MKVKKFMAPVRIDFGVGTTDISPFKDEYGGCILNAAISRYCCWEN
jgi:galactokinase/mevalonate kinase-like predicted kinase